MYHAAQATDYIDCLVQLEDLASNSHVNTLAINVAGAGYAVGDLFDINGGTVVNGLNATGEVLTEAAGVPTSIRLVNGGAYTANPGVGATTTAITGGGAGLTVDTTILATGWSVDRSQVYSAPERELLLRGTGSGTDEIFIGIQTRRNVPASVFYWELTGQTGFDNGELFDDQPGSSKFDPNTIDMHTPMNNGIIDYFFVIDTFHIKGVFKAGASFTNMYMGFINTYATAAEYIYPLMIIGCCDAPNRDQPFNTSSLRVSGMCDPLSVVGAPAGPGALRYIDGSWRVFFNGDVGSFGAKSHDDGIACWPGRELTVLGMAPDQINRFNGNNYDLIQLPRVYFGGQNDAIPIATNLQVTPGTPDDVAFLWPTVIYTAVPSNQFLGELIDVHPCSIVGLAGATNEDTFTLANGDTYIIFQNCNRTDSWTYFAMKRNF